MWTWAETEDWYLGMVTKSRRNSCHLLSCHLVLPSLTCLLFTFDSALCLSCHCFHHSLRTMPFGLQGTPLCLLPNFYTSDQSQVLWGIPLVALHIPSEHVHAVVFSVVLVRHLSTLDCWMPAAGTIYLICLCSYQWAFFTLGSLRQIPKIPSVGDFPESNFPLTSDPD